MLQIAERGSRMNVWILAGSVIAILTYFPLWKQIGSGKADQNFLTWALWGILDAVVAATIIVQVGNFLLPLVYAIGGLVTATFIFRSRNKTSWTWFETLVAFLTIASMVIWYFSGGKIATVASTTAMAIAGAPQFVDAWKKPRAMPLLAYFSFFIANCFSTVGGKSWTIEERFYPAVCVIICFLLVVLSARKYLLEPKQRFDIDRL